MRIRLLLLHIGVCSVGLAAAAFAQSAAEVQKVLDTAIRFTNSAPAVRQNLSPGDVRVDPLSLQVRGSPKLASVQEREAITSAVARGLGMKVSSARSAVICPDGPNRRASCHLRGAAAIIATSTPIITGDRATVHVRTWFLVPWKRSTPPPPYFEAVAEMDLRLGLVRDGGQWKVVQHEIGSVS